MTKNTKEINKNFPRPKFVIFGDDKIAGSELKVPIIDFAETLQCNHSSKLIQKQVIRHKNGVLEFRTVYYESNTHPKTGTLFWNFRPKPLCVPISDEKKLNDILRQKGYDI